LSQDHFNQLYKNERKIVPAQVLPHEADRHYLNALCHFGPCHAYKQKV